MNRDEMLEKLYSISKPIVALTAFSDGVICTYMSSKGCGEFELCDWNDLDEFDYDTPHETWKYMSDDTLICWIDSLENGDYTPIDELEFDAEQ